MLAEGGREEGGAYYPVVAAAHLAWIASLFFLISPDATIIWPLIAYYFMLQIVRYWVIGSLGRYWTHRIITLPSAPIVARGPYGYLPIQITRSPSSRPSCCRWRLARSRSPSS